MSLESNRTPPNFRHGLSGHPDFGRWYQMVRRCTNPRHPQYKDYGGRGLTVCAEWLDPQTYIDYVETHLGPQPDPAWSIDRIDNERGYEPGNIRWASRSQQNANQRQRVLPGYPVGTAGYRGVRLHRQSGRYQARLRRGCREVLLGYYDSPEAAARAYDAAVLKVDGAGTRLNFPAEVPA